MAPRRLAPLALAATAALLGATAGFAQGTEQIIITARTSPVVGGFGNAPPERTPLQVGLFGAPLLAEAGVTSIAGLARLDASVGDAYNTEGYWSFLSVRGFVLDNRSNYLRDGLPISAETAIGLANKDRIEVLKGTSGVQAGVSAPGGLVNLVVKRPLQATREAFVEVNDQGGVDARIDVGGRFGEDSRFGLRVNAQAAALRPPVRSADGERTLMAVAGDWVTPGGGRLEAEFETSRQSAPSVPGFSLRGDALPDPEAIDPRININNQPWSQPSVFRGDTASLRWRQRLGADWQLSAQAGTQRLESDDRIAFPYGCYDAVADVYYADRYCPDGRVDLYDFRSEGERRRTDAADLNVAGSLQTGPWRHELVAGVLASRREDRFQQQAFNPAGQGRDDGSVSVPPNPVAEIDNTNRDERSVELYLRDTIELGEQWSLWAGLRHVRLDREGTPTGVGPGGAQPTRYDQSFTTPWVGLAWQATPATMLHASWGEGVETEVVPGLPVYANAGQPLPALRSRQVEAGVKHRAGPWLAAFTAFSITRPETTDECSAGGLCTRVVDGEARHRGIEAEIGGRQGSWTLQASAMWLDAERSGALVDPALNGLEPENVPGSAVKGRVAYDIAAWPGLQAIAAVVHEGPRQVLPDNTVRAAAWTRLDLAARWSTRMAGHDLSLLVALDNATDERAWRDTPYQFEHAYLFPLAPRTWRVSLQAGF